MASLAVLCAACGGQPPPAARSAPARSSGAASAGHATATGTEASAVAEAASSPGAASQSFTILAAGDVLAHQPVIDRARTDAHGSGYDFRPMLARVAAQIAAADLAVCHVETPLSADDSQLSGYPVFNSPHEIATAFAAAGFDGCSTASNHSLDHGMAGVRATLDALDAAGLGHAGTARSAAERERADLYTLHGVRVAHLSYTYGTNGIPVPAAAPWAVNLTSIPAVLADARAARTAGARFVVVSLHWGTEYQTAPDAEQQRQARQLLASPDIDLILGDHVHVQQPVQRIGGKYVVYGLGNLLSNQSPAAGLRPETQDGALITVLVQAVPAPGTPDGIGYRTAGVTYTPTFCAIGSYQVVPVVAALADPATPASLRPALTASLARTKAIQAGGAAALAG